MTDRTPTPEHYIERNSEGDPACVHLSRDLYEAVVSGKCEPSGKRSDAFDHPPSSVSAYEKDGAMTERSPTPDQYDLLPGGSFIVPDVFFPKQPTPEQIKAFLDDLARISLRHGVVVSGYSADYWMEGLRPEFAGYSVHEDGKCPSADRSGPIRSIDLTQLSNHEKIKIMGGQV